MMILSNLACFRISQTSIMLALRPPNDPLADKLRINTLGSRNKPGMRNRSPNNDPRLNGDDGSIATIAVFNPCELQCNTNAFTKLLFPAPGGPVTPTIGQLPSSCSSNPIDIGCWFSTQLMALAMALSLPSAINVGVGIIGMLRRY